MIKNIKHNEIIMTENELSLLFKTKEMHTVIKLIEQHGFENIKDSSNNNLLYLACVHNSIAIVKYLVQLGVDINACNYTLNTPLHIAAEKGYDLIINELIKNGANSYAINSIGKAAFHLSCNKITLQTFVDNKIDITGSTSFGSTILHEAAFSGNLEVAAFSLKNNININIKNHDGLTPLHSAIKGRQHKMIQFLISNGADINIQTNTIDTPLHLACSYNDFAIIQFLLANNANVSTKNYQNKTPLDIASQYGTIDILNMLKIAQEYQDVYQSTMSSNIPQSAKKPKL